MNNAPISPENLDRIQETEMQSALDVVVKKVNDTLKRKYGPDRTVQVMDVVQSVDFHLREHLKEQIIRLYSMVGWHVTLESCRDGDFFRFAPESQSKDCGLRDGP